MNLPKSLFLAAATAITMAGSALAQTVSISTLPPGSVNNVQTQAIAKVVQEKTGIQMALLQNSRRGGFTSRIHAVRWAR